MPIPKTKDVGSTIKFLRKEKPGMPSKQKLAIALETARRSGADIPEKNNSIGQEVKRRAGKARTNAERRRRHKKRFGITKLPPKGTRLGLT